MSTMVLRILKMYKDHQTKTRVIDGDGIRIGNIAIDWDKPSIFFWSSSDGDWIEQELGAVDISLLDDSLKVIRKKVLFPDG